MSSDRSTAEIHAALNETSARRRRGWRLLWIALGLLILLLTLSPLIVYVASLAQGRSMLRKELAAIPSNEPLTTAEMTLAHVVPPGEVDITELWLAATLPFEGRAYIDACGELPFVGNCKNPPATLDDPWPDAAGVATFLQKYEAELAALHTAARTPGKVRYPHPFIKGIAMSLPEVMRLRDVARALRLQLHQQFREGQAANAIETVRSQFAVAETLEHEPCLIAMLVRVAIFLQAAQDLRLVAESQTLTDVQLAELQQLLRQSDLQPHLREAFIGERFGVFHAFHLRMETLVADFDTGETEVETRRDGAQVQRPADCAMSLKFLAQMIDASESPFPEILDRMEQIDAEATSLTSDSPLNMFRYRITAMLLTPAESTTIAIARALVTRDATDCLLAAKRYQLKHDKLPMVLADLVPEFLPQVPIDPFDGQPLRFKQDGDELIVYSVGEDRVDDQGQTNPPNNDRPDFVIRMKFK